MMRQWAFVLIAGVTTVAVLVGVTAVAFHHPTWKVVETVDTSAPAVVPLPKGTLIGTYDVTGSHAIGAIHDFSIPAGPLVETLRTFINQCDLDVTWEDGAKSIQTRAVTGRLHTLDALKQMLAGTQLVPVVTGPAQISLANDKKQASEWLTVIATNSRVLADSVELTIPRNPDKAPSMRAQVAQLRTQGTAADDYRTELQQSP